MKRISNLLTLAVLGMSGHLDAKTSITVFIHGTIAPGAVVFSPIGLLQQNLGRNSLYGKIADKARKDVGMREDWPLLDEGMIEITPEILQQYHTMNLDQNLRNLSAYQLAGAYNYFEKKLDPDNDYRYFFFGYNGLLDETERIEAGKALFQEIVTLHKQYKDKESPHFNLVGHSHGGTIGLYTAYGTQEEKNQPEITINNLIMLGAPLQKGQEELIASPFFKRIINIYSLGDAMQTKDFVSTKERKSYQLLADVVQESHVPLTYTNRFDLCLKIDYDPKAITHHTLWLMGKYRKALHKKSSKNTKKIFKKLMPLPLAAYLPELLSFNLKQSYENIITPASINLFLYSEPNNPESEKLAFSVENVAITEDVFIFKYLKEKHVRYATHRAKTLWQPYAICSEAKKHKLIFYAACKTIFLK